MIPKDCKRLAEVDLPVAEVSRHAAREKSILHGDPGTLHLLLTDSQTENNRRKE
jgi:putative DNA methylase